ncbi:MAG: helix-turn-helix domain-containing protein [Lachnospiraceae bacterium]|nr:helix-turn-helix domain-containing protein [Lachnospiraceae bacterium]
MKKPASILETLTDDEMTNVINRIVSFRETYEMLTQEQFAQKLHVSQSYISQLEAGKKPLTKSAFQKMLTVFNIDANWLLYGVSDNVYRDNQDEQRIVSNFLDWYKGLSIEKQASFAKAVKEISELYND